MKRGKMMLTNLILALILVASCSPNAASTPEAQDAVAGDALVAEAQLALGTLLLEDTDQAIAAGQASQLLPVWQALRSVLTSQNPAQAEIDALLKQIEKTLTPEQVATIRDMQLTQSSLLEWARSNGLQLGGPAGAEGGGPGGPFSAELRATIQAGGEIPPEVQATLEARRAQGGFGPRGGQAEGGGFSPELRATLQAGGEIPPEIRATFEARGGSPGGFGAIRGGGASLALIDRVIALLEVRSGE